MNLLKPSIRNTLLLSRLNPANGQNGGGDVSSPVAFNSKAIASGRAGLAPFLESAVLLFPRRSPESEFVTRAEFHRELRALENEFDAACRALTQKLDANHRDLLAAFQSWSNTLEPRIAQLESSLTRLERITKT